MRRLPSWLNHWYTYRGAVGILAGLGVALAMFALYASGVPGVHPEDLLFPGDTPPASDVVIVGIDDTSIGRLGHFPFTRDRYADAVDNLVRGGAAAIVFDIGFSEPFPVRDGDTRLHNSIAAAARAGTSVVLAYGSADVTSGTHDIVMGRPDQIPIRLLRCADVDPTAPETRPCAGTPIADLGSANVITDADGVVRRMPMFVRPTCFGSGAQGCQEDLNPIGFAGYRHYFLRDQADRVKLTWTPAGATFGQAWTQPLPTDEAGFAIINFLGRPGDFERHHQYLSFSDVQSGTFPADRVRDRVVLIGEYHATGIHDAQIVPTNQGNQFMEGIEIHANLVSMFQNQLNGAFLRAEPPALVLLTMLVLGVLVGWLVAKLSVLRGGALVLAVLAGYTVFWAWGMEGLRMVPDLFHVWATVFLAYSGVTAYRFLYEDREKRKVTAIFGQYLKPELVSQLAAARSLAELTLGGERRELSLLFCDIRGFTAMSETMAAEDVVQVAFEYLTELTRTIFKWDGTIDKYVGDEIVAVWNAPHDQAEHALLAVRCAYDMISHAPELQARLLARNLPPIRYGIGINTGTAVWGNLGSSMRRQFTALGDTVNTAARFCGAAGAFELLIGEPTYELCRDHIAVELAPEVQLKGKSADTFRIYKVVAIREHPGAPWVPFPTEMATQVTIQHTAQYRTQRLGVAAGATMVVDTPPAGGPASPGQEDPSRTT